MDEPHALFPLPCLPSQFPSLTTLLHLTAVLFRAPPQPTASTTYLLPRLPCCNQLCVCSLSDTHLPLSCLLSLWARRACQVRQNEVPLCLEGYTYPEPQVAQAPLHFQAESNACSEYFRSELDDTANLECHFPLRTCGGLVLTPAGTMGSYQKQQQISCSQRTWKG